MQCVNGYVPSLLAVKCMLICAEQIVINAVILIYLLSYFISVSS
jgi:hypothetical protein